MKLPMPEDCRCTEMYWRIMQRHTKRECPHMVRPYPGSKEAQAQGCTCPWKQNNKGEGVLKHEQHFFFVMSDCPLHNGEKK